MVSGVTRLGCSVCFRNRTRNHETAAAGSRRWNKLGGKLKKSMQACALLVAGVFALSGCGSSEEESAEAAPTVGEDQYSAEDLDAVLKAVVADHGVDGEIASEDNRAQETADYAGLKEKMAFAPESCATLLTPSFADETADANVALMMLNDTGNTSDSLTIVSHADVSGMEKTADGNEKMLAECGDFSISPVGMTGMQLPGTTAPVDASTEAESTTGFRTDLTMGEESVMMIEVHGVSGTTSVSVSMTLEDEAEIESSRDRAVEVINSTLTELGKK